MNILFITRKYPPTIGGMENFSFNLICNVKKMNEKTYFIANAKGNKNLPFFILYSLIKSIIIIPIYRIDRIHIGDGMLAPIGIFLKNLYNIRAFITIHGLDVTYKNKIYQNIICRQIKKYDKVFCVSEQTKNECINRGVNIEKISVIPNGINMNEYIIDQPKENIKNELFKNIGMVPVKKRILLSVGRLIKRKGIAWFVCEVMPKIKNEYIYFISGDGKESGIIDMEIQNRKLTDSVFLLGKTNNVILKLLYNSADIFIMPNIKVEGDMEGFGIVAIEASSCGIPVIASSIEGIKDAVIVGETGWLVEEKNPDGFIDKIRTNKLEKEGIIAATKKRFLWENIASIYLEQMQ